METMERIQLNIVKCLRPFRQAMVEMRSPLLDISVSNNTAKHFQQLVHEISSKILYNLERFISNSYLRRKKL